jgi:hypothetical protein
MSAYKHYLFKRWKNMLDGCHNPNVNAWASNGRHGVKVCRRWYNFWSYVEDIESTLGIPIGDRNKLGRVNRNKNWQLDNVRWMTTTELARTRIDNTLFKYKRSWYTIPELAEISGVNKACLFSRLYEYGWTVEEAVTGVRHG